MFASPVPGKALLQGASALMEQACLLMLSAALDREPLRLIAVHSLGDLVNDSCRTAKALSGFTVSKQQGNACALHKNG